MRAPHGEAARGAASSAPLRDSGGELACYIDADVSDNDGGTAKKVRRIVPRGGTLLLFDSTTLLHEVEPSRKDRYALTVLVVGSGLVSSVSR